ncbi:hypothetical protein D1Z30_11715 [Enterococcus faecalis]|nr:hypothetical protein [Enterococcus faecalis]
MDTVNRNGINISVEYRNIGHVELTELLKLGQFTCLEINELLGCRLKTDSQELNTDYIYKEQIKKDNDKKLTNYYTFNDKKVATKTSRYEELSKRYSNARYLLKFIRSMNKIRSSRIVLFDSYIVNNSFLDTTLVDLDNINRLESNIHIYFLPIEQKLSLLSSKERKIFLCRNINVAIEMKMYYQLNHWNYPFVFLDNEGMFRQHTLRRYEEVERKQISKMDILDQISYMTKVGYDGLSRRRKEKHITSDEQLISNDVKRRELLMLVDIEKRKKNITKNARAIKNRKTFEVLEKEG